MVSADQNGGMFNIGYTNSIILKSVLWFNIIVDRHYTSIADIQMTFSGGESLLLPTSTYQSIMA